MKKSLFIITAAALSLVACSRNQEVDVPYANLSLFARTESPADTKTVVESGVHVFWEPGDEIAVFMGEQAAKFTTDITAASGTATFKGTFGDTTWPEDLDLWAVYPFSEDAVFDGETITTTLPSEQIAREGSFGKDMNLSIAHSNSSTLQFYNVGGGIRFSVLEEGIKKVMFEGLSGEIIAGKVKIGMDKNGKPEVRDVKEGSQFITLLPPDGSETFQKDTWYYIVAIPGSLEGGYKLRFYKDSDYARKVSEKKVEIKRSIFGSLEKADDGIEYEATTTHYPETKEEWEESIQLTHSIAHKKHTIIDDPDRELTIDEITEVLRNIDGVIDVYPDSAGVAVSVLQKDSVCVTIALFNPILPYHDEDGTYSLSPQILHTRSSSPSPSSTPIPLSTKEASSSDIVKGGGTALILSPFQNQFKYPIDDWYNSLSAYFEVDSLKNSHADIESFVGISPVTNKRIDDYDFLLILTHGSTATVFFSLFNPDDDYNRWNTMLCTGTHYNESLADELVNSGIISSKEDVAPFIPEGIEETYLGFLPSALNNHSFNKSAVVMMACESAKKIALKRKMVDAFVDGGASYVVGNDISMFNAGMEQYVTSLLTVLSNGLSFEEAHHYASKSEVAEQWSTRTVNGYNAEGVPHPGGYSGESYNIFKNTLCFPEHPVIDYYFESPFPILIQPQEWTGVLEWSCNLEPFSVTWTFMDYWEFVEYDENGNEKWGPKTLDVPYNYTILYSLYVDGMRKSQTTDHRILLDDLPPDDYKAYVIVQILLGEGNKEIASYKSNEISFTVKEQIPAPPQVETFPASVDAQKAFLSGMVTNRSLEGLETGFYCYKLTAQEGSTELSASEKERLVMGGKKVLSAGDYKDYFGIDLTDIEQDSKYLFVAYATDEYSQTGKGEVLSFTTGSPSVHVSSVSLNMSSLELGVGNTATLVATVLPENASNKKVTWSSSDESRATVSSQGVVKGISMGNAVITVTTEDGGKTAQCNVSVTQSTVHVQSVSLNKTDLVLTVGNSETLVATVLPENAANKSVTWTSSNPSKATVSSTGVVTGVAEGAAVVTATTVDGGKTASCFVTVRQAAQPDPGESGNALIELSCDELDWGDVEIGDHVTKTFTVKNTGTTALNISSVSIVATDNTVNPSYFSVLPNSSSTVSPGNSLAFNVSFIPEAECGYYAIVSIKSNASNATQGTSTVWLTGVGIKDSSSHSVATPEIVDLGLSVKWASFNLGATKPEEYGDYFSWGETEPMDVNSPASYKFANGAQAFTKYNTDPYYTYLGLGIIDNKIVLDPEDDAAHVILGGNWRIPSKAEIEELIANCTWTWNWTGTTESGLAGYKVVSNIPGYTDKWIFLPAPGKRSGPDLYNAENYGYYWSSALYTDDPAYAYSLFFSPVYKALSNDPRHFGISIRPVYDDK